MNDFRLSADDPRLTAYALGELEGNERAEVEKALQNDPAAQAIVADIRRTAAELQAAFADESEEPVAPIEPVKADPYAPTKTPKLLRFPVVYYVVGSLAAACFAVLLALKTPIPSGTRSVVMQEKRAITAVNLPPIEALPEPAGAAPNATPSAAGTGQETDAAKSSSDFVATATELLAKAKQSPAVLAPNAPKVDAFTVPAPTTGGPQVELKDIANIDTATFRRQKEELERKQGRESSRKQELQYTASVTGKVSGYPREDKPTEARPAASGTEEEPVSLLPFMVRSETADAKKDSAKWGQNRIRNSVRNIGSVAPRTHFNTETYDYRKESDFVRAVDDPLSTFSIDVDTASYANVRRFLQSGRRPPPDAVRIEELLNYFPYRYAGPESKRDDGVNQFGEGTPFAASMETAEAPWAPTHRLVRIGLKGREVTGAQRGPANLVFLLDVSGSMNEPNKLPLVKEAMKLLVSRLRADDRVAIVIYAGATGLALPSTPVTQAHEITAAIEELTPGGSTNGAMGIHLAYDIAKANFISGGINRVILCTDGDFNVGVTSRGDLVRLITEKAKSGVFLTALGFGMGNYKDATLQQLADAGNGNYGYIDQRREAEKLLVEQVSGTLVTIAKDVKIQVEFNPAKVASYRLIGYEKRLLQKEDFNNDAVDAGEIGAGHTVTALYEIVPVGEDHEAPTPAVDDLRYATRNETKPDRAEDDRNRNSTTPIANELLTLKLRYKEPAGQISKKLEFPLVDRGLRFSESSGDFKFASAVAAFGMILRDSPHKGNATLADVAHWAEAGASPDPGGYRAEFLSIVQQAKAVM